ncbi:MAG: hypothetical protein AABX73_01040 [Nanoarchaeota archaeon]
MAPRRKVGYGGWAEFTPDEERIFYDAGEQVLFNVCESAALYAYCYAKEEGIFFNSGKFYSVSEAFRRLCCKSLAKELDSFDAPGELRVYVPSMDDARARIKSYMKK